MHAFPLRSVFSWIPFQTPFTHNPLIRSDEGLTLEMSAIVTSTASITHINTLRAYQNWGLIAHVVKLRSLFFQVQYEFCYRAIFFYAEQCLTLGELGGITWFHYQLVTQSFQSKSGRFAPEGDGGLGTN